ncbi:PLP-dependent aminotransferase family protein [Candidatus Bipolaricaulota bacterium]|nr:PLP-dependent aminotransferase family protein [Candidatus Bipolaricaulota bacterium]
MNDKKTKSISFNRGIPAEESLPAGKLAQASFRILKEERNSLLQYSDSMGYLPLREDIANSFTKDSSNNVLVGNGSLHLLDIIANLYLNETEVVIVEKPTYDRAITIFERAGAEVVGVSLKDDGVRLRELKEAIGQHRPKLFYTIPDFQNPTGTTTTREKRKVVADLSEKQGVTIVEDSPYRRLRYRGEDLPTLRSLNPESVIRISSFSKLICPGIRVGWLAGESKTVEKVASYAEDTYITPNLISQGLVYQLIREGWLEERAKELISLYRPRLEATLESLERYFPEANWVETQGGFFVGLWLPDSTQTKAFYSRAEDNGLTLSGPNGFFPDKEGEGFVRLPFPALSTGEIEEGIKKLAQTWQEI